MERPIDLQDPVTMVISEIVDPDRIQEYEAWVKGINQAVQHVKGFIGSEIICPRDQANLEYLVIVKFDSYLNFKDWVTSPTYHTWIDKSQGLIAARVHQALPTGVELWFSIPQQFRQKPLQPAYYKRVIVGVLAVYPLILLANQLLGPLLSPLHPLLGLFISVVFVSALLTYPVMPWLTTLLSSWLYPSATQNQRHRLRP